MTRQLYYPCETAGCPELATTSNGHCKRHRAARRQNAAPRDLAPCLVAGCSSIVQGGGYCQRHAHRAPGAGRRRPNPWRTGHWRDLAAAYLTAHPACEYPDCTAPATLVHHRDGTGRAGARANNHDANLEALCAPHHGRRHHELHHAGVLELGPRWGGKGSTEPRQPSGLGRRKKAPAETSGLVSQNSRNPAHA